MPRLSLIAIGMFGGTWGAWLLAGATSALLHGTIGSGGLGLLEQGQIGPMGLQMAPPHAAALMPSAGRVWLVDASPQPSPSGAVAQQSSRLINAKDPTISEVAKVSAKADAEAEEGEGEGEGHRDGAQQAEDPAVVVTGGAAAAGQWANDPSTASYQKCLQHDLRIAAVPVEIWERLQSFGMLPRLYSTRISWSEGGGIKILEFVPLGAMPLPFVDGHLLDALRSCLTSADLANDEQGSSRELVIHVAYHLGFSEETMP